MTGFSATQVLHKFPATYVGEAVAGKLHSMDDVIQKVLTDRQPTLAKELFICLSLAEVRYVEVRGDEEVLCMAHETSRIRAIGVYSQDRRFMGYIIKEEGKPLMSYVLRCNSAGLMVSLMSFLRQSCQLTFYQRGGSFYDELAADDVDDCDYIIDVSQLPLILHNTAVAFELLCFVWNSLETHNSKLAAELYAKFCIFSELHT